MAYSKHESPNLGRGIFDIDMQSHQSKGNFDIFCVESQNKRLIHFTRCRQFYYNAMKITEEQRRRKKPSIRSSIFDCQSNSTQGETRTISAAAIEGRAKLKNFIVALALLEYSWFSYSGKCVSVCTVGGGGETKTWDTIFLCHFFVRWFFTRNEIWYTIIKWKEKIWRRRGNSSQCD